MTKTPEQMANEYATELWQNILECPLEYESAKNNFLAGYQAAKDEYKVAIDTYNDVAKQMLEEAVRIMSPKDQLADADKVMNSPEKQDSCEHILDMEKMVDVNSLNNLNGWISVKERLPELPDNRLMSDDVLWLTRYGEMEVSCLELLRSEFRVDWGDAGLLKLDQFTHWMPLPEAPKEK